MINIYQNNIVVGTQTQMISVVSKVFPSTPPKKNHPFYRVFWMVSAHWFHQLQGHQPITCFHVPPHTTVGWTWKRSKHSMGYLVGTLKLTACP